MENSIESVSNNGEKWISSMDIAKKFKKQNKNINFVIRKLLDCRSDLSSHVKETCYKSSRGRFEPCFLLDDYAVHLLECKYEIGAVNPRFEFKFEQVLREMFPSIVIFPQYSVLKYQVDFFIPDLMIVIEYNEEFHKRTKDKDSDRMEEILSELNRMLKDGEPFYEGQQTDYSYDDGDRITCVVVEKGKEIDGLRKLCLEITDNTQIPCSEFMKTE